MAHLSFKATALQKKCIYYIYKAKIRVLHQGQSGDHWQGKEKDF